MPLHVHHPTSPHLQRLQNSMPPRRFAHGATPTSRPSYTYIASPAARLQSSIPPRLHACSESPEFHTCVPPRRYTCNAPPELHTSMPPCRHACSATLDLHTSTSVRLQHSRAPELHAST